MTNSELFGEKSAANILNMHPDSLRRLRRQGKITCYKNGSGRVRYRFEDLMAFAQQRRFEAVPAIAAEAPPPRVASVR